jgi:hypothetical protein
MYYTGIDPFSKQEVHVARQLRDRKAQRALMQFFKPANYFTVREALIQAGRADLMGSGCDCLIPAQPPKEAIEARRRQANDPDYYHNVANPAKGEKPGERGAEPRKRRGYRPGRSGARRQDRHPKHDRGDSGAPPWQPLRGMISPDTPSLVEDSSTRISADRTNSLGEPK